MYQNKCPSKEQLRAYALGKLSEDLANQTERHLQVCSACETTADNLDTENDSLIVQLREPLSNDHLLAEPECAAAISKAKLLAEKVAEEERLLQIRPSLHRPSWAASGNSGFWPKSARGAWGTFTRHSTRD